MARTTAGRMTLDPQRLPQIVRAPRSGPGLQPTALTADPEVLGLNISRGCAHRCAFCSIRGSRYYDGDRELVLYDDTVGRLTSELDARPRLPRAVFVSPSTDPFPPFAEVQEVTASVVAALAGRGVEAWLMTRGYIRPAALAVLQAHRVRVRVTVSLTTCDRDLQRLLEPWTASPRLRLKQIGTLHAAGVPVQVAIDPLVPGLTDTRDNLTAVLKAIATAGVRHVTASYLFLRDGVDKQLEAALQPHRLYKAVVDEFADAPLLAAPGVAPARYLPRARRQRGYGLLISLASAHGITVSLCGQSNPDFGPQRLPTAPVERLRPLSLTHNQE